ncbi:MAG TPA: GtrA family protein [Thermomicrobiaceae bacterium]|nr:GtrA family protein [Thermomicrobiaceae bacterium]
MNRDNNVGRYRLHWTSSSWRRLRQIIRPHTGRLIRFAVTGGLAGIVQLSVLQALTGMGWHGLPANALGILASTQVNFVLSALFIWRDRDIRGQWRRRWAEFHLATLATTLLNLFVFVLAELFVPRLIAAVLGIGVAGLVNYLIEDNLVFRPAARRNRTVHRGAPLKLLPLDEAADD